jgi:hypothetical protein
MLVLYSNGLIVHFLEEQHVGSSGCTGSIGPGDYDQTESQNKFVLLEIVISVLWVFFQ